MECNFYILVSRVLFGRNINGVLLKCFPQEKTFEIIT